ncbi:MAG: restriction endonuclease [Anaerolineaceae bacterium]|nr:restriction endonuclease [Anaerolineaceae bacterium]
MSRINDLRNTYHQNICAKILQISEAHGSKFPNFADKSSAISTKIALAIVEQLPYRQRTNEKIQGQTAGKLFEEFTRDFIQSGFSLIHHLRPGKWQYLLNKSISDFYQYEHLSYLDQLMEHDTVLSSSLRGGYIITPDIVISKQPFDDCEINQGDHVVDIDEPDSRLTPFRQINYTERGASMLHASISCKWTLRSDRAQNTRTEALNLIRNRKGHLPHVTVVTAEPLPSRIAALALGTGDLDCVYHFALYELEKAVQSVGEGQIELLQTMIEGRRLRDISDLPFDLAI